jgi:hypothetical protein
MVQLHGMSKKRRLYCFGPKYINEKNTMLYLLVIQKRENKGKLQDSLI